MASQLVRFLNIFLAGIMAGSVFLIAVGYNPAGYSAATYIEQQQGAITSLNTLLPLIGLMTIILTMISAWQHQHKRRVWIPLLVAIGFMVASALITRFGNQPINAVVMTWDQANAPADWTTLRDQWWTYHLARTATTCLGFALVVWAAVRK